MWIFQKVFSRCFFDKYIFSRAHTRKQVKFRFNKDMLAFYMLNKQKRAKRSVPSLY